MPVSNLTKGAILFGAIYFAVFFLAFGMQTLRTTIIHTSPVAANEISAALPPPTPASSGHNVLILSVEIIIFSMAVILEMKLKVLTRLHHYLKNIFENLHPLLIRGLWIGIGILLSILILFRWGFVPFVFVVVNGIGIWIVYRTYLAKKGIRQLIPVLITFVFFFILWTIVLFIGTAINSQLFLLFVEFIYFPLAFWASALLMGDTTKNRMNAVALLFSLSMPLFIGLLFTPIFALLLLAVFAVYDFIAVKLTRHMQFMAQKLVSMNVPEVFIIGDMNLMKRRLAMLKEGKKDSMKIPNQKRPLLLGAGDAILPSAVISAFVFAHLPAIALVAVVGCTIGILLNLMVLRRSRQVLPALVLIAASTIPLVLLALAV